MPIMRLKNKKLTLKQLLKKKSDTLTQQMNTHKTMAEDLRNKMQLELAQKSNVRSKTCC